jgi:hypothetical protein
MIETLTMQRQLLDMLEADPDIDATVTGDYFDRELKRAGSTDPAQFANDPTPDAFDPQPPNWLRVSIVIPERTDRGRYLGSFRSTDRYTSYSQPIAIYGPPDGGQIVRGLALLAARVLRGKLVTLPDGSKGKVVIPHDFIGPVPVPELPGAGMVGIERIEIVSVFRRD